MTFTLEFLKVFTSDYLKSKGNADFLPSFCALQVYTSAPSQKKIKNIIFYINCSNGKQICTILGIEVSTDINNSSGSTALTYNTGNKME